MSRTLDSLEEQGFVRRQSRADDMRVREVHITDAGRDVFQQFWPVLFGIFSQLFEGIEPDEYDAFIVTLHKVLRNIDRIGGGGDAADKAGEAKADVEA
jgi:DNA-binding MarR family transcriptional regulator